ncbi:MAG TPA: hypothetical protein VLS51_00175 [Propionibacteriaceae bacterium]|nr:hypothetical protein [Propionibacteriaceae bacterium]
MTFETGWVAEFPGEVVGDGSDTVAAQGQSPSGVAPQPADAILSIDHEIAVRLAHDQADHIQRQMTEQVHTHRHTPDRATILSERYVMGIRWVTVPCAVCGEALPERQM